MRLVSRGLITSTRWNYERNDKFVFPGMSDRCAGVPKIRFRRCNPFYESPMNSIVPVRGKGAERVGLL